MEALHKKIIKAVVNNKAEHDALRCVLFYRVADDGPSRMQVVNNAVAVDMPSPFDLQGICVPADKLLAALNKRDDAQVKATAKRLQVTSKGFKASIPLVPSINFPRQFPEGEKYTLEHGLIDSLKIASAFSADKKSGRIWMRGVVIRKGYIYGTDGMTMVRIFEDDLDPGLALALPDAAVHELLRINKPIEAIRASDSSATFKIGDVWLRTALYNAGDVPDLDRVVPDCRDAAAVPDGLLKALEDLTPFCEKSFPCIEIGGGVVSAYHNESGDADAFVQVNGLPEEDSRWRADLLARVLRVATHLDVKAYPSASGFTNKSNIDGAIMGVRDQ